MRTFQTLALFLMLAAALPAASNAQKPSKAPKAPVPPATGVKTPGIQIPFEELKAELDLPAPGKPTWLFYSDSLFAPNTLKAGIEKYESKTGKAGEPIAGVAKPCTRMASGFGSLWIPSCAEDSLVRLDAKTLKQSAKITTGIGAVPGALAVTADSVWLLTDAKTTLSRIDPGTNEIVGDIRVPTGCRSLASGEAALWLACPAQNLVLHINPATNLVTKRITVSAAPHSIAVGGGSIWALCGKEGKVERIDPKTDKVIKTIELGVPGAVGEIAYGEGSIWVTMAGFPLTRIDPGTDKVVQQFFGPGGGAIQVANGAIWLSNVSRATIWKIDPKRVAVTLAD